MGFQVYNLIREVALKNVKDGSKIKASQLWENSPALIMVVRRPGCKLCRKEAKDLADQRTQITEKWGIPMYAVVHEELGVEEFNQEFFQGTVYHDENKGFFKALGGGKLSWANWSSLLNPYTIYNYVTSGVDGNFQGEGRIYGGLYIVGKGDKGVIYEYKEKYLGDIAPMEEILKVCEKVAGGDTLNSRL
ncbi:hypothetical protein K493DRAFT_312229 [Basidiobolus meristosporus CBS 931.73]|uniref:Peroxiredoxin-like 2A n=1 Tax=Basidiobolus meristosporus CBS 931.73 TaxID=1314790 RepID=A0A1Y1YVC6_9FUNG|nr:hypothetical protein K493DRAFT_312229 [Basidiobolus meristosporus CBS 931.73]|eukprot:ORY01951.1 hypothetical protein K493DRAFT_312229 [Basidiobolus meristosporus CBS 931.73]